jgi:hypothetical protein
MSLQHLHLNSQGLNTKDALELTRGGVRMPRPRFCLALAVAFAAGWCVSTWITALF